MDSNPCTASRTLADSNSRTASRKLAGSILNTTLYTKRLESLAIRFCITLKGTNNFSHRNRLRNQNLRFINLKLGHFRVAFWGFY